MMIKAPICVLTILMTVTTFVYAKENTDHQLYNRTQLTERLTADDQADLNSAEVNLRASERALTLAQKVLVTAQNNRTVTANKRVALSKRPVTIDKGKVDAAKAPLALIQRGFGTISKFVSGLVLSERLTADDQADLNSTAVSLNASEMALLSSQNNLTKTANKQITLAKRAVAVAKGKANASKDALAPIQNEFDETSTFVRGLKEEQVFALNRSLNDALDSGLTLDIDSVDLALIENANMIQINAFTQAFKQQARFNQKADKFTARYKATGDEKFIKRAARMKNKGRVQKATFINKMTFFGASTSASEGDVKGRKLLNNKENSLAMVLAKVFIKR